MLAMMKSLQYVCLLSADEIASWRADWPCSGLQDRAQSFTFSAVNGDLLDMEPGDVDGAALLALTHDAGYAGAVKLGLRAPARHNGQYADKDKVAAFIRW